MKIRHLFARTVMLLVLAVLTVTTARAEDYYPEYISDIVLVADKSEKTAKSYAAKYVNAGYSFSAPLFSTKN